MKSLPLLFGTGLLCAGLAVGCADNSTNSGTADRGAGTPSNAPANNGPAWIQDAGLTKAHIVVTGMD